MTDLTTRLSECYSGAVYDVMRARGFSNCVLPPEITGMDLDTAIAGPVHTMRGIAFEATRESEDTDYLMPWVEFWNDAPAGYVVICQPQNNTLALMGELSAETLKYRGVLGYIVDGGCRDNGFIRKIDFPVFSKFRTPRDIVAKWVPDAQGEPIVIGDVIIKQGDYVLADIDGVVIIPSEVVEEITAEVEAVIQQEDKVRTAILSGVSPKEAYLKYGKF